jgi:hypothetical protein
LFHSDSFFRFYEFFFRPGGYPLGCAVLGRDVFSSGFVKRLVF